MKRRTITRALQERKNFRRNVSVVKSVAIRDEVLREQGKRHVVYVATDNMPDTVPRFQNMG